MNDESLHRRGDEEGAMLSTHLRAIDVALGEGDVPGALRAWNAAYGLALGSRRWETFAEAGDAYLRITRASGSPAGGISRARDLYLSALFRASGAGSLDGVLRIAAAFTELGDDEVVAHSLRIARRLAGASAQPELRERLSDLESRTQPGGGRQAAQRPM
jgi:hypothetical protein